MRLGLVLALAVFLTTTASQAQQGDALREAAQNPIADLISVVPFQNNSNVDYRAHRQHAERFKHSARLIRPISVPTGRVAASRIRTLTGQGYGVSYLHRQGRPLRVVSGKRSSNYGARITCDTLET